MSSVNRSRETETVSLNEHIFVSAPAQQRGRANANNKNSIVTAALFSSHSHTRAGAGPGPRVYRGFLHNSNYFNHKSDNFIALAATLATTLASPAWFWLAAPATGPRCLSRDSPQLGIFSPAGHQQRRQIASHLIFVFARVSSG